MKHDAKLDESTRRRAAVEASCDPRTIDKVMAGRAVRGLVAERARAALLALGVEVPPRVAWRPSRTRRRNR